MGKYNFSAMKFEEIEKRISELEARSAKFEAENRKLKEENAELKEKTALQRNLVDEIEDYSKVKALFGLDATDGVLKPINSRTKTYSNFQTFYVNILRALKPYVHKNTSKKGEYRIVSTPLKDFSNEEWKIVVETVNAVVDTIYYAKLKMGDIELTNAINISKNRNDNS